MSDRQLVAMLQKHLAEAEAQRLSLVAEVERLKAQHTEQLRDVAVRQREACAAYTEHERWHTPTAIRATPLVTEGES